MGCVESVPHLARGGVNAMGGGGRGVFDEHGFSKGSCQGGGAERGVGQVYLAFFCKF